MPLGPHSAGRSTEAVVSREIWKCEGLHGGPGEGPGGFPGRGRGKPGGRSARPFEAGLTALQELEPRIWGGMRVLATDSTLQKQWSFGS